VGSESECENKNATKATDKAKRHGIAIRKMGGFGWWLQCGLNVGGGVGGAW